MYYLYKINMVVIFHIGKLKEKMELDSIYILIYFKKKKRIGFYN